MMSDKQKNVLMICVDQWPGRLLHCAGHPAVMTPTLDQLAADGIRFARCYSTCPVCIPARRSLMTGLSPASHGDRVYSDRMPMPDVPTLAQTFRNAGYQTFAVGKLHVYPQRNRIGFDDVLLQEEGRYEFGVVDDYQIWLGEQGYTGEEFGHMMGNNSYYTRPWHLPEHTHPTAWATRQMIRQIQRKDPTRPAFFYISYQFPHPPLVPPQAYLDMYAPEDIDAPLSGGDWADDGEILRFLREQADPYTEKDIRLARRAFYAQCTFIDHQIRGLIGTLREHSLLEDTVIVFVGDHGDMLFDHGIVGKRVFYEGSANVPLIFSGAPVAAWRGQVSDRLACLEDVMPTLLDVCGIEDATQRGGPLAAARRRPPAAVRRSGRRPQGRAHGDGRLPETAVLPLRQRAAAVRPLVRPRGDAQRIRGPRGRGRRKSPAGATCAAICTAATSRGLRDGALCGFEAPAYRRAADLCAVQPARPALACAGRLLERGQNLTRPPSGGAHPIHLLEQGGFNHGADRDRHFDDRQLFRAGILLCKRL